MATSKIGKDLVFKEVPFSDFTWDSGLLRFVKSGMTNYVDWTKYRYIGTLVEPTNGTAMMSGYLNFPNLSIFGWIPLTGQSIGSTYQFRCYLVLERISS